MNEFYSEFRSKLAKTEVRKLARNAFVGFLIIVGNAAGAYYIESRTGEANAKADILAERVSQLEDRVIMDEYIACRMSIIGTFGEETEHELCVDYVKSLWREGEK